MMPRMVTIEEMSRALCMSHDEIRAMVSSGEIPAPRKSGKWRWASVDFALTREKHQRGSVYFVEAMGFIKIGFSSDVPSRLQTISEGLPVEPIVLHIEIGSTDIECDLHRRFSHLRVRGEWFRKCDELTSFIEGLRLREQSKNGGIAESRSSHHKVLI